MENLMSMSYRVQISDIDSQSKSCTGSGKTAPDRRFFSTENY